MTPPKTVDEMLDRAKLERICFAGVVPVSERQANLEAFITNLINKARIDELGCTKLIRLTGTEKHINESLKAYIDSRLATLKKELK